MARSYKRSNKSIQLRESNGRFKKATFADFGIEVCKRDRVCNQCGNQWRPIVATGHCPKCDAQDSVELPITVEEQEKLDRLKQIRKAFPGTYSAQEEYQLENWLSSRGLV
jgi:hypothetical protein